MCDKAQSTVNICLKKCPSDRRTRSHFQSIRTTSVPAATAGTDGAEGRHRATTGHTSTPHAHAGRRDPSWIRGARARAYVAPPDPGPPRALRIRPARPLRALRACARRLRASMPPPRRRPAPRWPVICMQIYSGVSCTSYTLTVIRIQNIPTETRELRYVRNGSFWHYLYYFFSNANKCDAAT